MVVGGVLSGGCKSSTSLLSHHPASDCHLGLAGVVVPQMAAMVATRSLQRGPSWLGIEPPLSRHRCQWALLPLYWCAPWFADGSHGCGLLSDDKRAEAVGVVASSYRLLGSCVGSSSELYGVTTWVVFARALG
jgi:hypothetical protein